MSRTYIENIILEQHDKIMSDFIFGGHKYGRDYNRLLAIRKHSSDMVLVRDIVKSIEDISLRSKVLLWMAT